MKIAINGDIIDTKDIYKITNIGKRSNNVGDSGFLGFEIILFNKIEIKVTEFQIKNSSFY